jgi:hypothetical protein
LFLPLNLLRLPQLPTCLPVVLQLDGLLRTLALLAHPDPRLYQPLLQRLWYQA